MTRQAADMAAHLFVALRAVQLLRSGRLVAPESLTPDILCDYAEIIATWQDACVAHHQLPEATPASVAEAMDAYWVTLRQDPALAELVAAVDQADVELLAAGDGQPPAADVAILDELATLSPVEYDRRRAGAAEQLGVRLSTVDALVARRRGEPDSPAGQGQTITFPDDDEVSWPEPVDGAALLDALAEILARYLSLPAGAADAMALWVVHTHAMEAWTISPLLALTSPQPRCGKTTALQILAGLVRRALPASNITGAAVFRVVERYSPTLVMDEADTYLTGEHEDIRGIINSGHSRGTAYVIRTVGDDHEPRRFVTWGAKAIALIGALPRTIADRSVHIPMARKRRGENRARWRLDRVAHLVPLRRQAQHWAADHLEALAKGDPSIPDTLHDRAADNWRALLAIAEQAGGAWPERTRQALTALEGRDPAQTDDVSLLLLEDIRQLYHDRKIDRISSADLCEALRTIEDRPWVEWRHGRSISPHTIARLLAPYGIVPGSIRLADGKTPKGYTREQCQDAFVRYLPSQTATTPQGTTGADPSTDPNRHTPGRVAVSKLPETRI